MFKYFISFRHRNGFGWSTVTLDVPLTDGEVIKQVMTALEADGGWHDLVPLHFQLLSDSRQRSASTSV